MSGIHVKFEISPDQFLSDLTQTTYQVALKHGFKSSFVEVELALNEAIRRIIRQDMMVSPACGGPTCRTEAHNEITSLDANP